MREKLRGLYQTSDKTKKYSNKKRGAINDKYDEFCKSIPLPLDTFKYAEDVVQFYRNFMNDPEGFKDEFPMPNTDLNKQAGATKLIGYVGAGIEAYRENKNPTIYEKLRELEEPVNKNLTPEPILRNISEVLIEKCEEMLKMETDMFCEEQKKKLNSIWEKYRSLIPVPDADKHEEFMTQVGEDYGKQFVSQNYVILNYLFTEGLYWKKAVDKYYKYYCEMRFSDKSPPIYELQSSYITYLLREDAVRKGKRVNMQHIDNQRRLFSEGYRKSIEENNKRKEQFRKEAQEAEERREAVRKEAKKRKNARKKEALRALLESKKE